jgi:hypothetical protein
MGRASGPGSSMAVRGSGAGRGGAHRCGPAGAVRSGKAGLGRRGGREGGAGGPSARASIGPTARIRRPRRRSCPSAPCATVGPELAGALWNSEQDRALTIEPARLRSAGAGPGGGGGGGAAPPPPGPPPPKVARRRQPGRSARARRPAARIRWIARVRRPLCTVLRRLCRALPLARVCRARRASVCAAERTSHVSMRCPKRQARSVHSL